MMKGKFRLIIFTLLTFLLISTVGCTEEESFVIPSNYSAEAILKSYSEKSENTYKVKVIVREGKCSLNLDDSKINWNISMDESSCILYNEKFNENVITINNFKMKDLIFSEFDLSKFNNLQEPIPEELIYWDGTYKHVMNFSKENLLPENISIYKDENLVKTIEYKNIEINQ